MVHRDDAQRLEAEATEEMRLTDNLRDRMLAERWMEMAAFMKAEQQQTLFIFAKELKFPALRTRGTTIY